MLDPFAASIAAGRSRNGGHTTISSRACPETSGKKSRKKLRVWSGVLYIFQLAALTFVRIIEPFRFGMDTWCSNDEVFPQRARMRARLMGQRARSGKVSHAWRMREL